MSILDYQHLRRQMRAQTYRGADPFPHIVIDNFLAVEAVRAIAANFPGQAVKSRLGLADRSVSMEDGFRAQAGKRWISREIMVPLIVRRLYWELNAGSFIRMLEQMSGIENLLPDPFLLGGGIHHTGPGGFLRVHADFNRHPKLKLDRRLNLLIYFNEDWLPEYGGNLELWNPDLTECVQDIEPCAGRCVIFSTTSTSWHGHPRPLACPPGRTRRSINLYYYSNGRPAHENSASHGTLWQKLPGEG